MDWYKILTGFLWHNVDPGEIRSWPLLSIYPRVALGGCCGDSEGKD